MRKTITYMHRRQIKDIARKTFSGAGEHKIMKLSASLAYTTVFSLAPLLVLVLFACGIFFGREAVEGTIYTQIKEFVGTASADQLQAMIRTSAKATSGNFAGIISAVALLIAATSLFAEIQDSLNTIWGVRPKPGKGISTFIKTRILSFGMIASLGFLLLVTLGISAVLEALSKRLLTIFSDTAVVGIYILNLLISTTVVTILFAVIFKVLPDIKVTWKQIRVPAFFTALFFMIGKFLISFYISKADVGNAFGAAGSLVILLVWIYYSSVILYAGAEFAREYALSTGGAVSPSANAEGVSTVEIPGNGKLSDHNRDSADKQ